MRQDQESAAAEVERLTKLVCERHLPCGTSPADALRPYLTSVYAGLSEKVRERVAKKLAESGFSA
jgi:hypothetical protein